MRISDNIKHCVCLVCTREVDQNGEPFYQYRGTAFFLQMGRRSRSEQTFLYLVTSRKNVLAAQQEGKVLWLRINNHQNTPVYFSLQGRRWHFPNDPEVDAAVLLCPGFQNFRYQGIPYENCATDEDQRSLGIGIGDELFVVGLFANQLGSQKNLAIIRDGIIAAMPEEPLYNRQTGLPYSAYLTETRSTGGLSGCPVFVCVYHGGDISKLTGKIRVRLLGLVRGHWDRDLATSPFKMDGHDIEAMNHGIVTVTPIMEITKLLHQEDPAQERRATDHKSSV
jgi:hypothetical protein